MGAKPAAPRYGIGDVVGFQDGAHRAVGRVLEPRGPLGVNRRHIYRLRVLTGADEPVEFEMPEDELEPAAPARAEVREYLATGGLVDMLSRNLSVGPKPTRVWLTYNPIGALTHTFLAEDGLLGGAIPPSFTLNDASRILEQKQGVVFDFLNTFGLNRTDAEEVVRRIGTA